MDKIEVTRADIESDMSWFMFAVRKGGRDVVILDYAPGWEPHNIEFHWEDTFQSDPPSHLEPGCYLWTGFNVGFWGEDDHIDITGGTFARFERDILATLTDATPVVEVEALRGNISIMETALQQIAGTHAERFGTCQTDVEEVPDLSAEEAVSIARNALEATGDTHPPATDVAALVEAVKDLRDAIAHMAAPARVDPDKYFSEQVKAFGDAFGYGALMTTASALWRQSLGDLQGGEFAVGPCVTTAANQLNRLSAALTPFTKALS